MITDSVVERVAEACHEALSQISISMGQEAYPRWEDTSEWMKQPVKDTIIDLIADPTLSPADVHNSWAKSKIRDGWVWGPEKSVEKKTHPCLVSYNELPQGERYKDVMFRMTATIHLSLHGFELGDPYTSVKPIKHEA